ncbi:MAG: hypothetical protein AB1649_25625 [Chloroflexota bacterium]
MKTQRVFRGIVFLVTLTSILFAAALPQRAVFAQEEVVRLTIKNYSDGDIWLKLEGPVAVYNLHVGPGQTRDYTPVMGVYNYIYWACGTWVKGELDLTTKKTVEIPNCGYLMGGAQRGHPNFVDAGNEMMKLVDVTFENKTGAYVLLILNGPSIFVFSFQPEQEREFTIPKGDYSYTAYGCGGYFNGTFYANYHNVKEITCP